MLSEVIHHARDDVDAVDDPKARALFETTAEVARRPLQGVRARRGEVRAGLAL